MIQNQKLKFSIFILCFLSVHVLFGQKLSMSIKSDNQSISDVFVTIVGEAGVSYMGTTDQNGRFTYQLSTPQNITISLDHLSYERLDSSINLSQDMDMTLQIKGIAYELNAVSFTSSRIHTDKAITLSQKDFLRLASSFDDPSRLVIKAPGFTGSNDQNNALSFRGMPSQYYKWQINGMDVVNPNHLANAGTLADVAATNSGGVNMVSGQLIKQYNFDLPGSIGNSNQNQLSGISNMIFADSLGTFGQASLLGLEAGVGLNVGGTNVFANYRYSFTGLLADFGVNFGGESIKFQDLVVGFNKKTNKTALNGFLVLGNNTNIFTAQDSAISYKEVQNIDYKGKAIISGISFNTEISKNQSFEGGLAYSKKSSERSSNATILFDDENEYFNDQSLLSGKAVYHLLNTAIGFNFAHTSNDFKFDRLGEFGSYNNESNFNTLSTSLFVNHKINIGNNWSLSASLPIDWMGGEEKKLYINPKLELINRWKKGFFLSAKAYKNAQIMTPPFDGNVVQSYNAELSANKVLKGGLAGVVLFYHNFDNTLGSLDEVWTYDPNISIQNLSGTSTGLSVYFNSNIGKNWWYDVNASLYDIKNEKNIQTNTAVGKVVNAQFGRKFKVKNNELSIASAFIGRGGQKSYKVNPDFSLPEPAQQIQSQPYYRVDLRVNYYRQKSVLSLDIQNIMSRVNEGAYQYDPLTQSYYFINQLGLIPVLSYRYYFTRSPLKVS